MKKRVTVYAWLLALTMIVIYGCGIAFGYSVGVARADTCSGWNGRFVHTTNCDGYQCTGISFGPFWSQNCNETAPPVYPPVP